MKENVIIFIKSMKAALTQYLPVICQREVTVLIQRSGQTGLLFLGKKEQVGTGEITNENSIASRTK